jgi:hypothetical protein
MFDGDGLGNACVPVDWRSVQFVLSQRRFEFGLPPLLARLRRWHDEALHGMRERRSRLKDARPPSAGSNVKPQAVVACRFHPRGRIIHGRRQVARIHLRQLDQGLGGARGRSAEASRPAGL